MGAGQSHPGAAVEPPGLSVRPAWLDPVAAVGLGVVAVLLRWNLPVDGLFYDDAWQALGVVEGSLRDLPLVGQTQPGFTLELLAWTAVAGTGDAALVTPALAAGALGPPLLYLLLRRGGFVRSVSLLLAAAMAVASVPITYSTRVKSYTTDVLIMMAITLILPRVVRARWTRRVAIAWVAGAILAATYSSFAVLGMVGAGLVIVLHPNGDRRLRAVAVGAQLATQALLLVAVSQQANTRLITGFFRTRGGFIEVSPNPVETAGNVLDHLARVVEVYPGIEGPRWLLIGLVVAAIGGLALAAWRGPLAVRGRFLGLTLLMAMAGSVLRVVPFGAEAGRVTLWTIPAIAVGLATAADCLRRALLPNRALGTGLHVAALGLVVLALVTSSDDVRYPPTGARDGTRHVIERLAARDAVWITRPTTFSFALYADVPVELEPTPERAIGFLPDFEDPRFVPIPDFRPDRRTLDRSSASADRVWVVNAEVKGGRGPAADLVRALSDQLAGGGYALEESVELGATTVYLWTRTAG